MKSIQLTLFSLIAILLLMACQSKNKKTYCYNERLSFVKPDFKGNLLIDGRFVNSDSAEVPSFANVIKWQFSRNPQAKEKKEDKFKLPLVELNDLPMSDNHLIWFGHASFYISIGGVSIVTDPNLNNIIGHKRLSKIPIHYDKITPVDYVLISHDHRDHFDKNSVKTLYRNNPQMEMLLPLAGERLFKSKGMRNIKRQEAGWFQEYNLDNDIRIIFLPAYHWGRRGLNDFNKTLWGSFIIIKDDFKIYFAGDSRYNSTIYNEFSDLFGEIYICIIPIGAYLPSYLMGFSQMYSEEAFQVLRDLRGKRFALMHDEISDHSYNPI